MLQAALNGASPVSWAFASLIATGTLTTVFKWLLPAIKTMNSLPQQMTGLPQPEIAGVKTDIASLNAMLAAEIIRQSEFRVEMRQILQSRTPLFTELARDQRILAEEVSKLTSITKTIQEQVREIENATRNVPAAIERSEDTAVRVDQIVARLDAQQRSGHMK